MLEPNEQEMVNPFLEGPARDAIMMAGSSFSRNKKGECRFSLLVQENSDLRVEGIGADPTEAANNAFKERDEVIKSARIGLI